MSRYTSNLVWIDLEMTGLDLERDTILEIATLVTDNNLALIAEGPSFVIYHDETTISRMDAWNTEHHTASGLIAAVRASTITLEVAQEQTLAFIGQYAQKNLSPLCGNSVWQDRFFLKRHMPLIDQFLNYRIIDVSSIKEVIRRWYPKNRYENFIKTENHRAKEDILQSVAELMHYKTYFFHETK